MEIRRLSIDELKPFEHNPRLDLQPDDPEYEELKRSIDRWDLVEPLVWNERTGNLVGGHQRLKILKDRGDTEVEVSVVDLDPGDEKALNIALNKIEGDWDEEILAHLLTELQMEDFDLGLTGFDDDELAAIIDWEPEVEEAEDDDFDLDSEIDDIEDPVTREGDVWILGRHRVMCGDATKAADIDRLTEGETMHMAFTDPPYNVDYGDLQGKFDKIKNDKLSEDQFRQFLRNFLRFLPDTSYVCCNWQTYNDFFEVMREVGRPVKSCIVWDKETRVQNLDKYFKQHEFILYTGAFGGEQTIRGDVWQLQRQRSDLHPTMKPVELVSMAITDNPKATNIIDLFGGSGSTLIAAEQLRRTCYTMEIDPIYCDVICRRFYECTGEVPVREDGVEFPTG